MNVNIFDIAPVLSDTKFCIAYMRGRNLLLQDFFCCNSQCSKVTDISLSDKETFQCNSCKKRYSIRTHSFWAKSHLLLCVLIGLLYFFCVGSSVSDVVKFFHKKVSKTTAIQWYNYFRDVMTAYLSNNPIIFCDCEVHVDETFIGAKRKYGKGRVPKCKQCYLFGIINKTQQKVYLQFVRKRNHRNIIPIIRRVVAPGCQVNSDGAQVYKILESMHFTVIHDKNYVDLIIGTHMNWIENLWSNLKAKLKSIRGSQKKMVDGHIDEFIYRYNRKQEGPIYDLMLQDIAMFYPV